MFGWFYRYFQLYAEHYNLYKYIKFNHKVIRVDRAGDYAKTGRWTVTYTTPLVPAHLVANPLFIETGQR